ncbi:DUF6985 domain-containing protein [Flavobacterium pectinovorum]|uniref:DUF6985 domain-containing protein n=1 Tax=Flavobacterium pectinovorum TaxID=29533 RepID=A0A502EBH0_9FLAO|nr:hypothetical protein [Flavobacterium pectinovorum]TPG33876.1 hypothetical protein EAH81_23280 [Flavobacterium pectinovorum]
MKSKIVGELKPLEHDLDFFESEPYPIPYFNNKKLKIGFVDARYPSYLFEADEVLENFLKLDVKESIKNAQLVFNYYDEILKFGYTKRLDIKTVEEVWNFVYPSEIIIDWDENGVFYLCVSCGCEWEEEHGLQLVFKNGLSLTKASGHGESYED